MDTKPPEGAKAGKYYMLTDAGIAYIKDYKPKENNTDKKPHTKTRKATNKAPSAYASVTADDLNVGNYPAVKSLSGAKEQVIMAMYIVTNENKGEWFTVDDVIYLLVNVFEVPADYDKVNGVFKRNKSMFTSTQNEQNKKALCHKLLSGAKDFAESHVMRQFFPRFRDYGSVFKVCQVVVFDDQLNRKHRIVVFQRSSVFNVIDCFIHSTNWRFHPHKSLNASPRQRCAPGRRR